MCEINPKRARYFRMEFFTAHEMTDARWAELTYANAILVEQQLNATGEIRVHIHEEEPEPVAKRQTPFRKFQASKKQWTSLLQSPLSDSSVDGPGFTYLDKLFIYEIDEDARERAGGRYSVPIGSCEYISDDLLDCEIELYAYACTEGIELQC